MEREALKLALDALENMCDAQSNPDRQNFPTIHDYGKAQRACIAIKAALAQPEQEPEMLTIAYQSGYYDGKQAALAGREWNFCERCGKRTADKTVIHTCTPPQGDA
jgi:hypothetical protein